MSTLAQLVGWVLAGFYALIPNYAVAIILLGLTFMLFVAPLTLKSTRSMLAMQKLQPKMKALQQQHKNDRLALNEAMTKLYKEEGVSPFGACLPSLLPLPLFYILYTVITGLNHKVCTGKGKAQVCTFQPKYIGSGTLMYRNLQHSGGQIRSLGLNLAKSAWDALTQHLGAGELFGALLLLVIMIAANYYQQVQITSLNPWARQNQQANPQLRMMRYFPIVFGLICVRLPSGLVVYYAVSALFRVGQQWLMYRYDPKVKALVTRDDRDIDLIEAHLVEDEHKAHNVVARKQSPKALPAPGPAKPGVKRPAGRFALPGQASASTARAGASTKANPPPRPKATSNGKSNGKVNANRPGGPGAANQRNRNRRRRGK
ncbi:MAG TPA: YidC/Oxa1 family membrane protein insertase [Acidimicrobiales bacterium]|nr:YidC/Oxa1 family membrane protein insertase [Acidimicrobiales bacterium]